MTLTYSERLRATNSFLGELGAVLSTRRTELKWRPSDGRNDRSLKGAIDGNIILYPSTPAKAWWGVSDTVLQDLRAESQPWAVVLMDMNADSLRGYVVESTVADAMIWSGRWRPSKKRGGTHWNINAPRGLEGAFAFSSVEELVGILRVLFNARENGG